MTQTSVAQGVPRWRQAMNALLQLQLRQPWRLVVPIAIAIGSIQSGAEEVKITTADDGAVWMVETTSFKVLEGADGVYGDMIIYTPNNAAPLRFDMGFTDCGKSTGTYMVLEKDQPIRYGSWSYHGNGDIGYTLTDLVGSFMCGAREGYVRFKNDQR